MHERRTHRKTHFGVGKTLRMSDIIRIYVAFVFGVFRMLRVVSVGEYFRPNA